VLPTIFEDQESRSLHGLGWSGHDAPWSVAQGLPLKKTGELDLGDAVDSSRSDRAEHEGRNAVMVEEGIHTLLVEDNKLDVGSTSMAVVEVLLGHLKEADHEEAKQQ
jgi:hypothetical protein